MCLNIPPERAFFGHPFIRVRRVGFELWLKHLSIIVLRSLTLPQALSAFTFPVMSEVQPLAARQGLRSQPTPIIIESEIDDYRKINTNMKIVILDQGARQPGDRQAYSIWLSFFAYQERQVTNTHPEPLKKPGVEQLPVTP
jgi:hypothetical protein